jgi:hypothetical protein
MILSSPMLKRATQKSAPRQARLKFLAWMFLILNSSSFILNCGIDIEDSTPPSPPQWVNKSLPEEWPERGIDAHESGGIFLEWEPNIEENIEAYLIYRAELIGENDSLSDYQLISRHSMEIFSALEYLDIEVSIRTHYIYKLRAEDISQNLSDYSESLNYSLLEAIAPSQLSPNGFNQQLNSGRSLIWGNYAYAIEMENYCLTLLSSGNELILRQVIIPENYFNAVETFCIPDSIYLINNKVYQWRVDIGSQYMDGIESAASESPWAKFLFLTS